VRVILAQPFVMIWAKIGCQLDARIVLCDGRGAAVSNFGPSVYANFSKIREFNLLSVIVKSFEF
jgi:hypothetical protein